MPPANSAPAGHLWLLFALLTVCCWGVYGVLLHTGQVNMADPANGRYKAFLFVGLAYVLVAVICPALMLILSGASLKYPIPGMAWSLVAGIAGAVGAFGVLLAFGAKGSPAVVMAIVFAGAPVVNALVAITVDPPEGGWGGIPKPFWVGLLLAGLGAAMVTYNKPAPSKAHQPAPAARPAVAAATP